MTDRQPLPPMWDYHRAAVEYVRSNAQKTQRFGQFFINYYMPGDTVWPEVFYEPDVFRAMEIIAAQYAAQKEQEFP